MSATIYHPVRGLTFSCGDKVIPSQVGTCAMGAADNNQAVLTPDLKVSVCPRVDAWVDGMLHDRRSRE